MSKVINSTGVVDSRYLLSQTPPNEVEENYYLHELQDKVDADWAFRPNRASIEQETGVGTEEYFPLEVVMQSVRTDNGAKISDDWRRLVFKDIRYKCRIGTRFRFSADFDVSKPAEQKSIWLAVNQDSVSPTAQQVVQRCNGTLGSIYVNEKGEKSYHYEPVVQTTDLKSVTVNYSEVAVDPRGQITITAQHNQYTKDYYINQRFVIGYDQVYKIKNIIKTGSLTTYDPMDVGVITIYMDMDQRGELDDFVNRIAYNGRMDETITPAPLPPVEDYQLRIESPTQIPATLGDLPINFVVGLYQGETKVQNTIYVDITSTVSTFSNYYTASGLQETPEGNMIINNEQGFALMRTKRSNRIALDVKCYIPAEASPAGVELSQSFIIKIGNT